MKGNEILCISSDCRRIRRTEAENKEWSLIVLSERDAPTALTCVSSIGQKKHKEDEDDQRSKADQQLEGIFGFEIDRQGRGWLQSPIKGAFGIMLLRLEEEGGCSGASLNCFPSHCRLWSQQHL